MIEVATPSKKTIEEVASFLNSSPDNILKSVLYKDEENNQYIAIVKGSDEVNETKLKRLLGKNIFLCTESTSLPTGFLGPVNAENIIIVADTATTHMKDAICGAMKKDTHCQHVCYKIDWQANIIGDIRSLRNGDPCPSCGKPLVVKHGMEIGHTFALNDRYTKPLKTTFTDVDGKQKNILMGCYGIGVTRLVAAIIEQYHDEKGIKWPLSVSPFAVEVIMVNPSDKDQKQIAESITQELENAGLEVLIDDREVSPGFKFKDSELLGIPYKVVCGRGLKENKVEFQNRKTGLKEDIPVNEIVKLIIQSAEDEMNGICNSSNSSL
jgi:prolyl-tRNA synthetase